MTELKPRATKQQLVDAMNKHNIFWRKRSWSASTSMGFSSNAANQIVLACTVEKRQRLVYSDRDPTEPCSVAASIGFVERIRGSHHVFRREGVEEKINLQCDGKHAKPYQVQQVRAILVKYQLGGSA